MGQADLGAGLVEFHLPGFAPFDNPVALDRVFKAYRALMHKLAADHGIK
ncbi:hypothetical protein QWZ10_20370 [Paracoccus cavernae]|uniref:Uncharacterized protein n=2 Tax=Paracoccus cavernae TaxID=1571207 RepID=A0ABT8D442_9RHOB|nr:hypothetical protein [Paracoccus cavernae]MDN3713507.1 hypothetical protein [Paracoccus cavernae]